jgi:NAD+ synthase (glutamine-hydrolysing)
VVPKRDISSSEARWFTSGKGVNTSTTLCGVVVDLKDRAIFSSQGITLSVAIGNDILRGNYDSEIIAIPYAAPELVGQYSNIKNSIKTISQNYNSSIIFSSAGVGESSTDFAFGGGTIIAENGEIINEGEKFTKTNSILISEIDTDIIKYDRSKNNYNYSCNDKCYEFYISNNNEFVLTRDIKSSPFVPEDKDLLSERCEEIFNIQTAALIRRMEHTNSTKAVIGISGGLDSTLAFLVAINAFNKMGLDCSGIVGITMPGFGTTDRTYNNAVNMVNYLGATLKEISIKDACIQHFKDIEQDINVHDVTYENSQARERTQILMDYANKIGALHLGTGDMSELALGWATYNGDHISMYNVNGSIPKTMVKYLVAWYALRHQGEIRSILLDVVNTPISPELTPADDKGNIKQKTEDIVGPYELHDFFLYNFLRYGFSVSKIFFLAKYAFKGKYDDECIKKWLTTFTRRFFQQQFKRSCLNDGPAVGIISLSPRSGLVMPSDMSSAIWLSECEKLS